MMRARLSMFIASAICCWYCARSRLMNAVMARIFGRAGSGADLRCPKGANGKLKIAQNKKVKRTVLKRIDSLPRTEGCFAPHTLTKIIGVESGGNGKSLFFDERC